MGDKARAKARMRAAGVPCVPGFDGEAPDDATLMAAAAQVGFPLLVKAAAGGGGPGMRRVGDPAALPAALQSARREAEQAFGCGDLLLERLVENARHIEIQVMADAHGAVLHLGERDCSTQRRHQKVLEEAPSPFVGPKLRARMGAAATAAARAVGYQGAGTVEFLVDAAGDFYFLEMNTRLQVEHPVTEAITGLDLVALQLSVAAGQPLPFRQEGLRLEGHAIEVRLTAEAPAQGYAPRTGPVHLFRPPTGEGQRCDHGLRDGLEVSADYDSMLAKIIAWGPDRETARRRLQRALEDTVLVGVETNRRFLGRLLAHPDLVAGAITTGWLEAHPEVAEAPAPAPEDRWAAVAAWLLHRLPAGGLVSAPRGLQPLLLQIDEDEVKVGIQREGSGWRLQLGDGDRSLLGAAPGGWSRIALDGHERSIFSWHQGPTTWVQHRGALHRVQPVDPAPAAETVQAGDGRLRAPSAARVLSLLAAVGDHLSPGDPVLVVEAMKLETTLRADRSGTLTELRVSPGQAVAAGQILALISAPTSPSEVLP